MQLSKRQILTYLFTLIALLCTASSCWTNGNRQSPQGISLPFHQEPYANFTNSTPISKTAGFSPVQIRAEGSDTVLATLTNIVVTLVHTTDTSGNPVFYATIEGQMIGVGWRTASTYNGDNGMILFVDFVNQANGVTSDWQVSALTMACGQSTAAISGKIDFRDDVYSPTFGVKLKVRPYLWLQCN